MSDVTVTLSPAQAAFIQGLANTAAAAIRQRDTAIMAIATGADVDRFDGFSLTGTQLTVRVPDEP